MILIFLQAGNRGILGWLLRESCTGGMTDCVGKGVFLSDWRLQLCCDSSLGRAWFGISPSLQSCAHTNNNQPSILCCVCITALWDPRPHRKVRDGREKKVKNASHRKHFLSLICQNHSKTKVCKTVAGWYLAKLEKLNFVRFYSLQPDRWLCLLFTYTKEKMKC